MEDKEKRQKRIQQKENHIQKQLSLSKTFIKTAEPKAHKETGRYAKTSWCSHGDPNCIFCMNPRKLGELTIQELKQEEYANSFRDDV